MAANTLGRYHIIREIARSNDIVYEAMDPAQGKKIALKELQMPQNLAGQARHERIQRFIREARSAASLKHTNIVRIFDHNQVQGRYYIAMEFLEGQSLRDVLRQRGAMPLQEALRIASCVADGLEFAHKNGVVHRDIKPDNVHLEPDGRVVITDFGIARLTFEPSLTADGQIFGTPSYMSPEQVTGKGIDKRSDIFSLGVMLYEMVSGRKPFTGDSVITITYNIMNVDAPPLTGAPYGVEQVVRKAMAKDPNRRYRTAAELQEDLQLVARGSTPRHAAASPAPSAAPSAPRPQPTPRPRAVARVPQRGPRPASRPLFGAPPGSYSGAPPPGPPPGSYGGAPPAGPPPGARPLPPAPWGAPSGHAQSNGGGAAARPAWNGTPAPQPAPAGYAPAGAVVPGAPQPFPVGARPASRPGRSEGGFDFGWFMGWLAIAVVIAGIILLIVWSSVTAYDRFNVERGAAAVSQTQQAAKKAYDEGRFEEALNGYLAAAKGLKGAELAVVRSNASSAAVKLARLRITAGNAAEAEQFARQALELSPDSGLAYTELGRARALAGDVDGALKAFDDASAATARVQLNGTPETKAEAKSAAENLPFWKADVLYRDGLSQMSKNQMLAKQRFEAVIQAAPNSAFAKNAAIQLQNLDALGVGYSGAQPPADPAPVSGVPSAPEGWDPSYKTALPNSSAPGPGGGLSPPLGLPR
ncbi:MAG: protein kinase domain-containing protein [Actinomycetota bacterium]